MARTPLFAFIQNCLRQSLLLNKHPELRSQWEESLDRREFLKRSAITSAALLTVPHLGLPNAWAAKPSSTHKADAPVMILGAGLAGLTCAYELSRRGIACEIYEASERVGGRVWTRDRFNSENMFCELGGELIDSGQADIQALAKELGLQIEDLSETDPQIRHGLFYFQGKHYFEKDIVQQMRPLASRMAKDIATLYFPTGKSLTPEAKKFDRISLQQYLAGQKDFAEKWLIQLIEQAYVGEYGLSADDQSSLNLLTLIDTDLNSGFRLFGASDENFRIRGGNSRLVEALHRSIQEKVRIHLGHRLVRIAKASGGELDLTFTRPGGSGSEVTKKTTQTVCTLPFTLLRQIEGLERLGLSPAKLECIQNLGYGTNGKYMLGFTSRIWRQNKPSHPATDGSVFTDLPSQSFWETSRKQPGNSGILTCFSGGSFGKNLNTESASAILSDLEKIHPGIQALHDPKQRAAMCWFKQPFAQGSYACARVGQYTKLMGVAAEPELSGRLLFAGEHCSKTSQGFMNGAVETGKAAAKTIANQRGKIRKSPRVPETAEV